MLCKRDRIVSWIGAIVAAAIVGQTLPFKFMGAELPVRIFTLLGQEPVGRIGGAVVELVAVVLLLIPRTAVYGAVLTLGVMAGAILGHLTVLGIEIRSESGEVLDSGELFVMAWIVTLAAAAVLWVRRGELPFVGPKLACGVSRSQKA
mgnify:CR=1 FL=1